MNYSRDFKILHNTVTLNGTFPWGAIEYRFTTSNGEIRNNLTDAPIWRRDGAWAALSDNVTDAALSWFAAAGSGDLHLRPDALAAIDRAPVLPAVRLDFDGEERPAGARADAGADEVHGPRVEPSETATKTPPLTPSDPATATPPPRIEILRRRSMIW